MLMTRLFGENLLDDFFDMPTMKGFGLSRMDQNLMSTDVKETDNGYEVSINLPGFKKEDIKAELKDGYLMIQASTDTSKEDKDEKKKYIRKERYSGSCSRSFYVGNSVSESDIKAKFDNGVLTLDIPKVEKTPEVEQKRYVEIEG